MQATHFPVLPNVNYMEWSPGTEVSPIDPITTHVSSHDSVGVAIVTTIAEARECDIHALDQICETIDLDAIDRLYSNSTNIEQTNLEMAFITNGCKIILYGDGRLVVAPLVDAKSDTQSGRKNRPLAEDWR